MKYIYDIVLNFQNEFIDFYEWNKSDICEYINKIRLYLVSNKDYLNLKYHDCTIENKLPSIFLVTNGLEVIGLRFNKQGKLLKRSSLLFEEANDIITKLPNLKRLVIKYKSLKNFFISGVNLNVFFIYTLSSLSKLPFSSHNILLNSVISSLDTFI